MALPLSADQRIHLDSGFFGLFLLAGLVCLAIGVYFYTRRQQWLAHSVQTQGVVIDVARKYLRDDKSGQHPLHFPRVRFSVNGQAFTAEAEEGSEKPVHVGQPLGVRYNPANPGEAALDTAQVPGLSPKLFFVLGSVFALLGVVLLA
jgi:hypothetical protein